MGPEAMRRLEVGFDMSQCPFCKLPKFYGPSGFSGPQCQCFPIYTGMAAPLPQQLSPQEAPAPTAEVRPLRQPRHDLARLVAEIKAVVYATGVGLSVTEAIGALELAKIELIQEQQ